jgi:glutaredoxin
LAPAISPVRPVRVFFAHFVVEGFDAAAFRWFSNLLNSAHMAEPRQVVVYSRKGCHLCEIIKETLTKLQRRGGFSWRDIDVDSDDELRRRFTDEVPVVFIDGHKAFKYHMDEREFLRKLAS